MLLGLSIGIIVASLLAVLLWLGRRPGPPPLSRDDGVVDWTRQWRRALNSLDRPSRDEIRPQAPAHVRPSGTPPSDSLRR